MKKELICINCPMGCRMSAEVENGHVLFVTGYTCKRGERYAQDELTHPMRTVTALASVAGRAEPLPVKTTAPIPKELVPACLRAIRGATVLPPVRAGAVILPGVCGTQADVIATADVSEITF